jgi:hypothetical protein
MYRIMGLVVLSTAVAACGGNSYTDPGHGTATLLVNGTFGYEGGGAQIDVHVVRAGAAVTDATVIVSSNLGTVTLTPNGGGGDYQGVQPGWADGFSVSVKSGTDNLQGGIDAPNPVQITSPDPGVSFDPHMAPNGLVHVTWAGDRADTAHVESKDFKIDLTPDSGSTDIPATSFVSDHQDIDVRRENSVNLAGGAPGSTLTARYHDTVTITVTNPF